MTSKVTIKKDTGQTGRGYFLVVETRDSYQDMAITLPELKQIVKIGQKILKAKPVKLPKGFGKMKN